MITWTPATGTPATLCHGTERGVGKATGPARERVHIPAQTQIIRRIRAPEAEPLDRGNRLYEYTFSVNEQFATPAAAQSALHGRRAALGRSGALTITTDTQTITYSQALLDIEDALRTGVNILFTYKITAKTQVIT